MKRRLLALLFGLSILLASCADTAETSSVADNTEKQESSTETSETEQERVMIAIGKERLEVVGVDISPDADGVYLFTPDGAEVYAADQNHTDYAVVNTVVAAVGRGVQIPQNGYVMRLVGVQTEQEIAVGTRITYRGEDVPAYLPERYVRFGDTVVEVGYKNTTRTAEQVGFLFDDGWYANSTCSNIWGMEIAVDGDGKVVTVNPSGQPTSGNTPIPEGGFVLSVGADTPNERALRKIKVGDTAEYVEQPQIYTAKRYSIAAKNETASDAISQYTRAFGDKTPTAERVTELVVDKDGIVIGVFANSTGGREIPEGGYVLVATGTAMASPAAVAQIGTKVGAENTNAFWLIENVNTAKWRCQDMLGALQESYTESVRTLAHIDFEAANEALQTAKETVDAFDCACAVGRGAVAVDSKPDLAKPRGVGDDRRTELRRLISFALHGRSGRTACGQVCKTFVLEHRHHRQLRVGICGVSIRGRGHGDVAGVKRF